jgi:GGDEF domain-containing protein
VDRLRLALADPVAIAGTTIPIRASMGLVEVDSDDPRTAEEILRDADRAMYMAKRARRMSDRRSARRFPSARGVAGTG